MLKEKQIRDTLKRLLIERNVTPAKMIVFGSQVKGNASKDSDVDIIVLSKSFEGKDIFERVKMARGLHRELVKEFMISIDIMYCSLSEWNKGASLILRLAKKEGVEFDIPS
ncbi:MAG: nucleotidyltransferase domain-containing protein [Candidatus Omnitrophota bacterium]